jgi:hypothetical protein
VAELAQPAGGVPANHASAAGDKDGLRVHNAHFRHNIQKGQNRKKNHANYFVRIRAIGI